MGNVQTWALWVIRMGTFRGDGRAPPCVCSDIFQSGLVTLGAQTAASSNARPSPCMSAAPCARAGAATGWRAWPSGSGPTRFLMTSFGRWRPGAVNPGAAPGSTTGRPSRRRP